ncbi:MAG: ATPase V [Enterococcus lacertideformus]|uniref:ATPase V n=1 Tax=Enterococcus lacertideformus TaxID=2771493 RepID=A0A931FC71_9ENTE|nr:ATPase V [Enterococcus lacertideformus]
MLYEEAKRQEIDQLIEAKKVQLEAEYQKEKTRQLEEIEKTYRQLRNKQKMQVKQQILNTKQEILQRIFAEATRQLENQPKEEQLDLLKNMLQTLSITGKAFLIPGEKTAAFLSPALIKEWNQELPFEIELADHLEKNQAGFVIDNHGIQYNFIFSHLIKEVQETMGAEIAKELFD